MPIDRDISEFSKVLKQFDIHPNKKLGQHFLVDPYNLNRIVVAADLTENDSVLEIGAGIGNLTRLLAPQVKRVVAVEKDTKLIRGLQECMREFSNVEIITGDILDIRLNDFFTNSDYSVVSNIPYNITSKLIRRLLETNMPPKFMVLTIQEEVAERICAEPGKMNILAVSVQIYGKPEILFRIPAVSFYPPPEVDSAVLRINRYVEQMIPVKNLQTFFNLVRAGFSQKRKNLRNSLSAGMHWSAKITEEMLSEVNIDPKRRAETLTLAEWSLMTEYVIHQAQLSR